MVLALRRGASQMCARQLATKGDEMKDGKVLLATYPERAGDEIVLEGQPVLRVPYGTEGADIVFQRYTADYSKINKRQYRVGKSGYINLTNAVRAVLKRSAA